LVLSNGEFDAKENENTFAFESLRRSFQKAS